MSKTISVEVDPYLRLDTRLGRLRAMRKIDFQTRRGKAYLFVRDAQEREKDGQRYAEFELLDATTYEQKGQG